MTYWETWLAGRLAALKPAALYILDDAADRFGAHAVPAIRRCHAESVTPAPGALALGIDALTELDAAAARHLIHRVRLYVAPRLLLIARADCALDDAAFRSLGFICEAVDAESGVRIHSYDLATYKATPDWLNARYWANPERWEP